MVPDHAQPSGRLAARCHPAYDLAQPTDPSASEPSQRAEADAELAPGAPDVESSVESEDPQATFDPASVGLPDEHIGVKTTRIRYLSGELTVMSKTRLLGSCIDNYKHMRERRAVFKLSIEFAYPTQ